MPATRVQLRDVLIEKRQRVAVADDGEYPIAGVYGFARGVIDRNPVRGSDISATHLFRIRARQIVYSRLKAFEGAFALVPEWADGRFVSNEFPTFDVDEELAVPEYVALVLSAPSVWAALADRITGVGARRERLKVDDFLDFETTLPPVDEQAVAVEAVAVFDEAISAYTEEREACGRVLGAARQSLLSPLPTAQLRELVDRIESGKSPKALERPPELGEIGVLKVSAVRPGEFRPRESKAVIGHVSFPEHARVKDGDVLITRANTRQLVGSACRVKGHHRNLFLCDKTLRLVPRENVNPDFLIHALATSGAREHLEMSATGSSESMKNISQPAILETPVPFTQLDEQTSIAQQLTAIQEVAQHAAHLLSLAKDARASLVLRVIAEEFDRDSLAAAVSAGVSSAA